MGILDNLLGKVNNLNNGLQDGSFISEIIRDNDFVLIGWNADDQLYEKGQTATGVFIADYLPYKPTTVWLKEQKGQPTDRVTLRDTEDFHNSFFVDADSEKFTMKANDWKTRDLMQRYGDEIMGLDAEHIQRLEKEILMPELSRVVMRMLF